jgi:hypothetical protein
MSTSLYDATVGTYLQILNAVPGILDKGRIHCESNDIDTGELVETRLYPDMMPFSFQIVSVAHHSLGALKGVQEGLFVPPSFESKLDYGGLQDLVSDALSEIEAFTPETVNAFEGKDVEFKLGERSMPFTAEGFLMSFSLPNFYFHATTTYDILRMKGVPIGKRDFMGQLKLKK